MVSTIILCQLKYSDYEPNLKQILTYQEIKFELKYTRSKRKIYVPYNLASTKNVT